MTIYEANRLLKDLKHTLSYLTKNVDVIVVVNDKVFSEKIKLYNNEIEKLEDAINRSILMSGFVPNTDLYIYKGES